MALLTASCAANPKPSKSRSEPSPLPRSSIAAVLEHRVELELTDDQVRHLQQLDEKLQQENAAIRKELGQGKQASGQPAPDGFGGGMGRRSRGGGGGRRSRGEGGGSSSDYPRPKSPMQLMDENDTRAYLEAEALLTETQRPQAREIASRFREQLSDRREAARKRGDE
jgi:hypothetical protein